MVVDPSAAPRRLSRVRRGFVALMVVGAIVNYLDRNTLSIANTTIASGLRLDNIQMGLLLSAFSWPYAIANLPAGYLVDKYGAKRLFGWAASLWSAVTMLTAFVSSFGPLYSLRVALGVAESPAFNAGLKVCQRWYPGHERSRAVAILGTGPQIANTIAPPLLTALLLTLTWRGMFFAVGAFGLVVALVWAKAYRDPTPAEEAAIKGAAVAADTDTDARAGWVSLLGQPNTWFMVVGGFGISYMVWVYLTWLPSFLQTSVGFSLKAVGAVASLPFLCGILGVLAGGYLSAALIRRGTSLLTARKIPIVGGAVLAATSVLPLAYAHHTVTIIALLCTGYFFAQMPIAVAMTLACDLAEPHQVASLGSIQNFGGFLGAATAPLATGVILQRTGGNYTVVFLLAGILLLMGAAVYGLFIKDPAPRPREIDV